MEEGKWSNPEAGKEEKSVLTNGREVSPIKTFEGGAERPSSEDEEGGRTNRVGAARPKTAEKTVESGGRREKTRTNEPGCR
jgi:hypothetical protein